MSEDALLGFLGRCVAPSPPPPPSDEARAGLALLERASRPGQLLPADSPQREVFEAWAAGVRHALLTRCPCGTAEALALQRGYEAAGVLVPTPVSES